MFSKPKLVETPENDCLESNEHPPGKWSLLDSDYDPPVQIRTCPVCNKIVDFEEIWKNE